MLILCFLFFVFFSSLYNMDTDSLLDVRMMKILSYSVGFFLFLLLCRRFFCFLMSHLTIIDLNSQANGVLFRKSFPMPASYSPCIFSSRQVRISGFEYKSLINVDLNIVQGDRYWSNFILLHVGIQFFQHCLLKMIPFLQNVFSLFIKCQMAVVMSTHI